MRQAAQQSDQLEGQKSSAGSSRSRSSSTTNTGFESEDNCPAALAEPFRALITAHNIGDGLDGAGCVNAH